ncbi:MAG: hypothetical protein M1835_005673 [Candelina submexicana]|nr:MAG: hypothetical protein M1835_005673 [Candelina submexicana]
MHPLNPFIRAFFRSTIPSQCTPVQHHILLVPTTEVLLTSRDRESNTLYADLAGSEEFLASHALRVPGGTTGFEGKDGGSVRDTRGKARQFTTVNGRTVVVKDTFVYSNKGFKTLNQAQLLNDVIYYPDILDAQQWLIYYISKPLIGSVEAVSIIPATIPARSLGVEGSSTVSLNEATSSLQSQKKKDVKSFNDLLNNFPMIARQMQPGLENIFKEFGKSFEKPLPATPNEHTFLNSDSDDGNSKPASLTNGHVKQSLDTKTYVPGDEDGVMRQALYTAVASSIELFQQVDKQQLSLLASTTDLTGPVVERLLERYISEQVHDSILFPKICAIARTRDVELESRIKQMENVDISQAGFPIPGSKKARQELTSRLRRGIEEFRKLGVGGSPHEMMDILLATTKTLTVVSPIETERYPPEVIDEPSSETEKTASITTVNADTLVSLLLIVVIRSQIRHLHARLLYIRHYIFIDDVESGQMGYTLSTFEACLSYLTEESRDLRKASRINTKLWEATKNGDVKAMKAILEPHKDSITDGLLSQEPEDVSASEQAVVDDDSLKDNRIARTASNGSIQKGTTPEAELALNNVSETTTLAHVFPFRSHKATCLATLDRPRPKKRVSMDIQSLSSSFSSSHSFASRTTTIDSRGSGIEGDTSIERLSKTQDPSGDSVIMMAIESRQPQALRYLLSLREFYPPDLVFDDSNNEGTTLLSAAVQLAHTELVEIILDFILQAEDDRTVISYFEIPDSRGRTVAHYLFNAPHLISRIGRLLPWRRKDKNGQTPLFALCRSYDHPDYNSMIDEALHQARQAQKDGGPLHLDDHVDAKGNTLLHVVNDPQLARMILYHCDSDPNATNDKRFTPLMVASKYGRIDMVRALFSDPRLDLNAKEFRGLTAVELAKDDEIRNRIDDLVLFSSSAAEDGRITAVVRSFFVEDATIRLVLKSGAPNPNSTVTVTTCRRSLAEFEALAKLLAIEHPASWLPSIFNFRSPFQIPSKPSRAVLRDIQYRLDNFLRIMLAHSTFSTHEMLWEFFLVPDLQPEMMVERSQKKAEIRAETVKEEYEPVTDLQDVESFVGHAREMVRGVNHSTRSVIRRATKLKAVALDLSDAHALSARAVATLPFLPPAHIDAFNRYSASLQPTESSPYLTFLSDMHSISSTISAILSSLARPHSLITSMTLTSKAIDRHLGSLRRSDRWPLGLLDDTRNKIHQEAADKVEKSQRELATLGSELRYTQQTVASELAGWQDLHQKIGKRAVKSFVRKMVVGEKARLECMRRAVRGVFGVSEKRRA